MLTCTCITVAWHCANCVFQSCIYISNKNCTIIFHPITGLSWPSKDILFEREILLFLGHFIQTCMTLVEILPTVLMSYSKTMNILWKCRAWKHNPILSRLQSSASALNCPYFQRCSSLSPYSSQVYYISKHESTFELQVLCRKFTLLPKICRALSPG